MRAKTSTKTVVLVKNDQLRINDATRGLIESYPRRLGELSPKYISVICDYICALRSEIKLSNGYRQNIINTLIALSRVSKRGFKDRCCNLPESIQKRRL
jgi:hypothetical protein